MRKKFVENYKKMTDDEVILLINNGDYDLLHIIIKRYYPVIHYYVHKYCPVSYREDAIQEATFALYSAVKDYDAERSTFSSFAHLCIKRAVIAVVKMQQRKKNIPDELLSSIEDIEVVDSNSPEKIFFEKEDYKNLADTIKLELSTLEYEVLQFYLSGMKYSDISSQLKISEKSVDNALSRIRKKLKSE